MKKLAVTGIGPDKPGITAALTEVLLRHQANIEDTSMTRLGQLFAMILILSVPDDIDTQAFETDLKPIETDLDISLNIRSVSSLPDNVIPFGSTRHNPYMVSVSGYDQMGITCRVAKILAKHQLNITDLNAQQIEGEKAPVYIMMIETDIPQNFDFSRLDKDFEALEKELKIEIKYHPIETATL